MKNAIIFLFIAFTGFLTTGSYSYPDSTPINVLNTPQQRLVGAAVQRTQSRVIYNSAYRKIKYPGGDVPNHFGVCTDLIIRSYRNIGIDLQRRVHEDMRIAYQKYPNRWRQKRPDHNIDHRRVPNLEAFFRRHNAALPISKRSNFLPGDVVSWRLPSGAPHIGIVHRNRSADGKRPLIIHNIGQGPRAEDMLYDYKIVGHFRYFPTTRQDQPQ